MDLIIASNNIGKIKEYKDIFEPFGFHVYSQAEKGICLEVEETGKTFEENAFLKAKAIFEMTGCPVISDDSGLEVKALHGEPGIYSARYHGLSTEQDRRKAILSALQNSDDRSARFVCCICYIGPDGQKHIFKGVWNGRIADAEEGTNGFGYDPIFISEDADGKTTASLPISFKEQYSHRAKAVKQLMKFMLNERVEYRFLKENEKELLKIFLYEAIFISAGIQPPDHSIIDKPELKIYYDDFGKGEADYCIVADLDGTVIGAVWTRIMNDYGHIDDRTPSFAISVYKEYRGKGIGTKLMKRMLRLLKEQGYEKASLAVQKNNYAVRLYENVGFEKADENLEEYIMVCELSAEKKN